MTEDDEAHITMFMRVVEFFRKNSEIVDKNEKMKEAVAQLKGQVQQLFDLLSEEDHDRLLERYQEDLEYLNIENNNESMDDDEPPI